LRGRIEDRFLLLPFSLSLSVYFQYIKAPILTRSHDDVRMTTTTKKGLLLLHIQPFPLPPSSTSSPRTKIPRFFSFFLSLIIMTVGPRSSFFTYPPYIYIYSSMCIVWNKGYIHKKNNEKKKETDRQTQPPSFSSLLSPMNGGGRSSSNTTYIHTYPFTSFPLPPVVYGDGWW
jgi:hypothetical protein